ncbi:hypothetical protein L6452_18316 [Arctium lappa]|uniref:Uncharacterized protein n=1 Tax=Arctium lappa TaxID=4217 RepID=A0ACB9C606_ARCLA|nr:hypothetical protein L6452_18316 [Arctium lappa]
MAATLQPKLRGFSIVNDMQENWKQMDTNKINETSTADILTGFLSVLENLIGYLIRSFNNLLPPQTDDDQIRNWLHLAGYYVIAVVVIIMLFVRRLYSFPVHEAVFVLPKWIGGEDDESSR